MVFCKSIIHHLPMWGVQFLSEVNRCLKEDGVLIIAWEPGLLNPIAFVGRNFFPTREHTPNERPMIFYMFKRILYSYGFKLLDERYFYLVKHILPIVGRLVNNNLLRKILIKVLSITERIEESKIFKPLREFMWIYTGLYQKGKQHLYE